MELKEHEKATITEIANIMQSRGVEKVEVEYCGSGDSQDCFDVSQFKDGETVFLDDADDEVALKLEQLVDDRFSGYENNDGGNGEMSLLIADGSVHFQWDHTYNYVESQDDGDAVLSEDVINELLNAIKKVGAQSCRVNYEGGGDSMDGYDIVFTDANQKDITPVDQSVLRDLNNVLDDLMCNGPVAGFWNNEGGGGEIFVSDDADPENVYAYWNHYNYYENGETDSVDVVIPLSDKEPADA